jgi:hypothetical protein
MPFVVDWFIPNQVLLFNFYDEITLDDVTQATIRGQSMTVDEGDYPVHLLVDARRVTGVPYNVSALLGAMTDHHPRPDVLGWVAVIAPDHFLVRFIAVVLGSVRVMRINFRLFRDLPSAILFLRDQDERLRSPRTDGIPKR